MKINAPKISENEIIILLKKRDKKGISILYDQYSDLVFGLIHRIVKMDDMAETVLQDSFFKVWRNIDTYDECKGRFLTWVLNIARNTAIDMVRSKDYRQSVRLIEMDQNQLNRESQVTEVDTDRIGIREIVARLQPKYKEIIELIYFGGYTHNEVSKKLSLPLGTVKSRVKKAFHELRILLT